MKKLRIDGETISSDKMYRGKRVLELIEKSYGNGYMKGLNDASKQTDLEATRKLSKLKDALIDLLADGDL